MSELNGFYAYPSQPAELGQCIEKAADEYNRSQSKVHVNTWTQLDVIGQFISTKVLKAIDDADFLIADITNLNFNVTYEIGYAVGKSKRVLLTKNKSVESDELLADKVGIFDTLGFREYQNSQELKEPLINSSLSG
ncbi:hypothetical protein [Vreelandella stevensii]|uniref:hypothetical protein n=1 Tax=Vreelandella stevensii TaxID=502821 RepID=UPI00037EF8DA|nr:hypothetical protein [Halomonas stevensii]